MTEEKSKNILVLAKEVGVSHDDIREFLLKQKKANSEAISEEVIVDEETEKISEDVSLDEEVPEIEEDETEIIPDSKETEEEPIEEKEPLDIETQIKEEVIKQLKVKRKTPSKGKIKQSPSVEYGVSNRGYEELV